MAPYSSVGSVAPEADYTSREPKPLLSESQYQHCVQQHMSERPEGLRPQTGQIAWHVLMKVPKRLAGSQPGDASEDEVSGGDDDDAESSSSREAAGQQLGLVPRSKPGKTKPRSTSKKPARRPLPERPRKLRLQASRSRSPPWI